MPAIALLGCPGWGERGFGGDDRSFGAFFRHRARQNLRKHVFDRLSPSETFLFGDVFAFVPGGACRGVVVCGSLVSIGRRRRRQNCFLVVGILLGRVRFGNFNWQRLRTYPEFLQALVDLFVFVIIDLLYQRRTCRHFLVHGSADFHQRFGLPVVLLLPRAFLFGRRGPGRKTDVGALYLHCLRALGTG